jgi:hypothetical protein
MVLFKLPRNEKISAKEINVHKKTAYEGLVLVLEF